MWPSNDKSFQTLILSIILHGILVLFLSARLSVPWPSHNETAEIVLIEKEPVKRARNIVTQLKPENLTGKLQQQADFLSQFTQRVKEQMRARNSGETRNLSGRRPSPNTENRVGGLQAPREPGETAQNRNGLGRNIVMGESSLGEHIPGVKEGSFTALNTDQFTYYTFFARINEQVRYRWVRQIRAYIDSLSQQQLTELARYERSTQVEIILNREGEIVDTVVHFTSGDRTLDAASESAFQAAAPFRNPPQGMVEGDNRIHLHYKFFVTLNPSPFVGQGYN